MKSDAANPDTPDEHETKQDEPDPQPDPELDVPQGDAQQAEQVAPAAPTPTTVQTTDQLKAWFVDVYVPDHKDDTPNPTRDDALAAARLVFKNYIDRTHLRDDLREIWKNHAPEGWKKGGPRPKPE